MPLGADKCDLFILDLDQTHVLLRNKSRGGDSSGKYKQLEHVLHSP